MFDWKSLYSPYTPPAEVFAAVCAELGAYYTERGAKYTKSKRLLKFPLRLIRCEIGLWSSHSNTAGEWVNLEIVTSVFAVETDGMERRGILNAPIRPNNFNVVKIDDKQFAEITAYIDDCLKRVGELETREGAAALFNGRTALGNPNNAVYFERYFGNAEK